MAVKNYYLDKRTLKEPTLNAVALNELQNTLNLKEYVNSIIGGAALQVFPDGTAAAPGITFVGDTDTGIYLGGNNILGFSVAGVKTFDIRTNQVMVPSGMTFLAGGGVFNIAGTQIAAFYPQVAQNNITAGTGGAIIVTNYLTTINTDAGGDAFTLANGTQVGQMKKISLVVDGGGDGVVTPATAFAGGTTATFNDAGDFLILQWSGTAWVVIENSGVTIA